MTGAEEESPKRCTYCGIILSDLLLRNCANCKQMLYCSKACQADHWADHRRQCRLYSKISVNPTSVTTTRQSNKQCLVQCYLQGLLVEALWDTGSQVCIVGEVWKTDNLPNVRLRDVSEAIDAPEELRLVAANGQNIPFIGWMEVTFGFAPDERKDRELIIPMLVMRGGHLCHPIIGYNVIEQVANRNGLTQPHSSETLVNAIPNLVGDNIRAFIERVQEETSCEYILKTTKEKVYVPKHTSVQVECRVQTSAPKEERVLLFEPDVNPTWPKGLEFCETLVKLRRQASPHVIVTVQNPTDHDIMLNGKTIIGTVHPVQAVYPAAALETPRCKSVSNSQITNGITQNPESTWDPPLDLSHLSESRKQMVQQMLREEAASFSRSDDDIGCIEGLQLNISLKDTTPVTRT